MKKLLSLVLCLLLLISSAFAISCKDDKTAYQPEQEQNKSKTYGAECLVKLTANITGATGMGIEEEITSSNPSVASGFALTTNFDDEKETAKGKKYLVKGDKDNKKDKVSFKNETNETIKTDDGAEIKPGETITQEQIKDQINKLYVDTHNDLTYIQYIPQGEFEIDEAGKEYYFYKNGEYTARLDKEYARPENLEFDQNGLTEFDTMNYFTNNVIKSYVIDNKTGKIYPIKDIFIMKISDGLVHTGDGFVCDAKIQDGNLVLTSYFTNKNIQVTNFFRDKYNNVYIENKSYENIDKENKIVFCNKGYYKATNGEVVYFDFSFNGYKSIDNLTVANIQKVKEDLTFENVAQNDKYYFNDVDISPYVDYDDGSDDCDILRIYFWDIASSNIKLSHISEGFLYLYTNGSFVRFNIVDKEKEIVSISDNGFALDYNTMLKFDNEKEKIGNISYAIIDF